MFSRLFIAALWSPAGKGLTSWLSFVMFDSFVTFPCVILGQVWNLPLPHILIKDKLIDLIVRTFNRKGSPYLACNDKNAFLLQKKKLKTIMHGLVKMYVMR